MPIDWRAMAQDPDSLYGNLREAAYRWPDLVMQNPVVPLLLLEDPSRNLLRQCAAAWRSIQEWMRPNGLLGSAQSELRATTLVPFSPDRTDLELALRAWAHDPTGYDVPYEVELDSHDGYLEGECLDDETDDPYDLESNFHLSLHGRVYHNGEL